MLRTLGVACLIASILPATAGRAFMILPAEDAPGGYLIGIEGDLGDRIPFSALPSAFHNPTGPAWRDGLSLRWRYFRSSERGGALLALDASGRPTLAVEISGDDLAHGDTLAVAIGLTDRSGTVLHTVYVAASVANGAFPNGSERYRIRVVIDFEPERWEDVGGLVVHTMKYYAVQTLDESGIAKAMRRAVERERRGGGEQWLLAG